MEVALLQSIQSNAVLVENPVNQSQILDESTITQCFDAITTRSDGCIRDIHIQDGQQSAVVCFNDRECKHVSLVCMTGSFLLYS